MWASQRQPMVTLSIALKLNTWIRCVDPTVIYIDNQSAIRLTKNLEYHKRTKHIDIRYHFICERIEFSEIYVEYVFSEVQKPDILIKALPKERFKTLRDMMGLWQWNKQINAQSAQEERVLRNNVLGVSLALRSSCYYIYVISESRRWSCFDISAFVSVTHRASFIAAVLLKPLRKTVDPTSEYTCESIASLDRGHE